MYVTRAPLGRRAAHRLGVVHVGPRRRATSYGRTYPFEYDRRHAATAVVAWRPADRFDVSVTGRFASGFPRTPVVGPARRRRRRTAGTSTATATATELVPGARRPRAARSGRPTSAACPTFNRARLPAFARVDLRATFKPRGAGGRWQLYLDVINVLNRENAGLLEPRLDHDPDGDRPRLVPRSARAGIPFLPSLGVRFRF